MADSSKVNAKNTWTVKRLIESLNRFPSDLPVYVFVIDAPVNERYLNLVDCGRNQDSRAPIGVHLTAEID